MPLPQVCNPCDCPGEGCLVCVTPQVCGVPIAADIDLWDTNDCSTGGDGSIVASGATSAESATWCTRVPDPGWYSVWIAPIGGAGCARCVAFEVTADDCASEMGKGVVVPISPLTHDVVITVKGCCGCTLPGVAVTYDDGTATAGGTTDTNGVLTLTGLTAPCEPEGVDATIVVTGQCGYEDKTVVVPVDVCSMPVEITLDVDADHVCIGGTWPVHKVQTYVGAKSGSITLHLVDPGDGCTGAFSWVGCGTYSASDAAVPVVCDDDLYDACDEYRYEGGTATVPVIIILNLAATCCQTYDNGGTPGRRQRLLWQVIKIMPMTDSCECGDPSTDGWRVVGQGWCYVPGLGCTATATTITLDDDCNLVGCGYSPGQTFPAGWGYDEGLGRCVHANFGYWRYDRFCETRHYTAPGVYTDDTEARYINADCEDCWTGTVLSGTTYVNYSDTTGCIEAGNPYSPTGPSIPEFVEGYSVTLA